MSAMSFLKDTSGRYEFINRQFEKAFGVTRESVAGLSDHDLFPDTLAETYIAADKTIIANGTPAEFDKDFSKNGSVKAITLIGQSERASSQKRKQ